MFAILEKEGRKTTLSLRNGRLWKQYHQQLHKGVWDISRWICTLAHVLMSLMGHLSEEYLSKDNRVSPNGPTLVETSSK